MERKKKLLVGLGNPGKEYKHTRHNIGFEVVEAFAKKHKAVLVIEKLMPGFFAKIALETEDLFLLMPLTYMNASGTAVRRCTDYFKIPIRGVMVVADDIELEWQTLRLRQKGRCGGHKGLLNIEERLCTQEYSRLRIGVGYPEKAPVADYVLGKFTEEEDKQLPEVIQKSLEMVDLWLKSPNLSVTMDTKQVNNN